MYEVQYVGELRINLPPTLHKALRLRAVKDDKTLRNFIIEPLEKTLTIELTALLEEAKEA